MEQPKYRFKVPGTPWPKWFRDLCEKSYWAVVARYADPKDIDTGHFGTHDDQELTRLLQEQYQCRVVRNAQKEMFLEWTEEKYYAWFLLNWK